MSYPLPPRAHALQEKVRAFVAKELIPWEVHAEMNNGEVPDDVRKRHKLGAREAGLYNMDIPVDMGGQHCRSPLSRCWRLGVPARCSAIWWHFHRPIRVQSERDKPTVNIDCGYLKASWDSRRECGS